MNSNVFIASFLLVITVVEAKFDITEEAVKCVKESRIDIKSLEAFEDGENILDYDTPEVRRFVGCRYGKHYDKNHQLIIDEGSIGDAFQYYSHFIIDKEILARALAKDSLEYCKKLSSKTNEESAYFVGACVLNRLKEYNATCTCP